MSIPKPTREKATPRLSASLILLNGKHDVLMIQRVKNSRTFAGMHAFPGGNYDVAQDVPATDPRMTAIRETFEETGVLLATPISPSHPPPSPAQLSLARRAIHSRTDPTTFPSFLVEHHLSVTSTIKHLIPFTQWVTPVTAKSRFWTWFYVAFLDEIEDVLAAEDVKIESFSGKMRSSVLERVASTPVPTHDNHVEIQSAYFQSPHAIIQAFDRGDITLMPPQFYLLTMLAELLDHHQGETKGRREDRPAARYMRDVISRGFGGRVFNPWFGGSLVGDDGVERSVLMYEGDAQYGKGLNYHRDDDDTKKSHNGARAKHRSLLTFVDGRPRTIRIERTIGVLGLDSKAGTTGPWSKL